MLPALCKMPGPQGTGTGPALSTIRSQPTFTEMSGGHRMQPLSTSMWD